MRKRKNPGAATDRDGASVCRTATRKTHHTRPGCCCHACLSECGVRVSDRQRLVVISALADLAGAGECVPSPARYWLGGRAK